MNILTPELRAKIYEEMPSEAVSSSACVCKSWNDSAKKNALINKVKKFPKEILDTFGGVHAIANLPEKFDVRSFVEYRNSIPKRLTAPIMLGFDESKIPFLIFVIFCTKNSQEPKKQYGTLRPNNEDNWELSWGYNDPVKVIGVGSEIHYDNLKSIVMGKKISIAKGARWGSEYHAEEFRLAQENLDSIFGKG